MARRAINLKIEGDRELLEKLRLLGARANAALLSAARAGADVIEDDAEPRAPGPHIITGNEKLLGDGIAEIEIGPDEEHWYYRFVETGATPHEIKGNPLVFEGDAGLVVTKQVAHTGMEARPFLRPAADTKRDAARDAAGEVFKAEIDQLVESHGD